MTLVNKKLIPRGQVIFDFCQENLHLHENLNVTFIIFSLSITN